MKVNVKNVVARYKDSTDPLGNPCKMGFNANGDLVWLMDHEHTEHFFDMNNGGKISKVIKDGKVYKCKIDKDNKRILYHINETDSTDIYTYINPISDTTELLWLEIKHVKGDKICKIAEINEDTANYKKVIDYENNITAIFFPNGEVHISKHPDKTIVYDYKGNFVYEVRNGAISKYNKEMNIVKVMYEENNNRITTYPTICAGADIRCVIYPSGLQYWYRNDKLIMKKYARGTIIMYNKKGRKDKMKYKIMADGTKVFYNQRENPTHEIKPNGTVYKYRGGRRISK